MVITWVGSLGTPHGVQVDGQCYGGSACLSKVSGYMCVWAGWCALHLPAPANSQQSFDTSLHALGFCCIEFCNSSSLHNFLKLLKMLTFNRQQAQEHI